MLKMTVINTVRKIITNLTDRIENHENRVDLALMYKCMLNNMKFDFAQESSKQISRNTRNRQ